MHANNKAVPRFSADSRNISKNHAHKITTWAPFPHRASICH